MQAQFHYPLSCQCNHRNIDPFPSKYKCASGLVSAWFFRDLELFCCYSPRDFIIFLRMLELLISLCFPWISPWIFWRRTEGSLSSLSSQALALDKLGLRCRERFITGRNLEKVAIPQGSNAGPASQHKSTSFASLKAWTLPSVQQLWWTVTAHKPRHPNVALMMAIKSFHFDWFVVLFMVSMLARGQRTRLCKQWQFSGTSTTKAYRQMQRDTQAASTK